MILKSILIAIMNMVWDIFWPLSLGFILPAIIRTYISTILYRKESDVRTDSYLLKINNPKSQGRRMRQFPK